ncbi:MAG: serine hydrolase domain-containing protein [Actinomycetota bacterium]
MNELISSALDRLLNQGQQSPPGLVFGLSIKGERKIIALGDRQLFGVDSALPMTADTSFDLGSITKVLATTASLMRLIDSGGISLGDKVSKFLGEWSDTDKEEIVIKDLLLHRSGLWEWRPLYINVQDPAEVIKQIAAMPLRYLVNQGRHYSDLGFISLGQILTTVAGESLRTTASTLVFEPLQMRRTQFAQPIANSPVAATSFGDLIEKQMVESKVPYPVPEDAKNFSKWRSHVLVGEVNDGNAFHIFGGVSGHAGLFASAEDLLQFGEALNSSLKGEGIFSQSVAQDFFAVGPDVGQRLGFRSWSDTYNGCTTEFIGHTGFPGTVFASAPSHNCVVVLLTNRLHVEGVPTSTEELWQPVMNAIHQVLHG